MRTIAEIEQAERLMRGASKTCLGNRNVTAAASADIVADALEWVLGGDGNGFDEMLRRLAVEESMATGKAAN